MKRAIEFFSGIGGLHCGLKEAAKDAQVVAAFDTNVNANETYFYNYGIRPSTKGINLISKELVDKFNANIWLLSPPCQPFTKGGKHLDDQDPRSLGLLNIIKILEEVRIKPDYLFLENVPNFETSECRNKLVKVLVALNYDIDEFLVSPLLIGVPNDRMRYYLCAKRGNGVVNEMHFDLNVFYPGFTTTELEPLSKYLEDDVDPTFSVSEDNIRKRTNFEFDVVQSTSTHCSTFTKAYGGHHFFGSGSMLQTCGPKYEMTFTNHQLIALKPRYFTPSEIQKLHCFPENFKFPDSITRMQKYKLLGNSLNCRIVGMLLSGLFNVEMNINPISKKIKT